MVILENLLNLKVWITFKLKKHLGIKMIPKTGMFTNKIYFVIFLQTVTAKLI